jgi:GMP synthase (glutamine-hydrolysing)
MPLVHVLQNERMEDLGIIAQVLQSVGLDARVTRTWAGEPVPRYLDGADGLIVLGGSMSVYDHGRHPFLLDALRLVDQALRQDKPVLGVCLGSQILATCLGAQVRRGQQRELGWHMLELSEIARADRLWGALPDRLMAFHWHGDVFELPPGCESLASSELTECQAFVYGRSAYGVLCHLELSRQILEDLLESPGEDLLHLGSPVAAVLAQAEEFLAPLQQAGRMLFQAWAMLCLEAGST